MNTNSLMEFGAGLIGMLESEPTKGGRSYDIIWEGTIVIGSILIVLCGIAWPFYVDAAWRSWHSAVPVVGVVCAIVYALVTDLIFSAFEKYYEKWVKRRQELWTDEFRTFLALNSVYIVQNAKALSSALNQAQKNRLRSFIVSELADGLIPPRHF